ncbi:MAG: TolC family protein [Deltaproteobacteria bacterium]
MLPVALIATLCLGAAPPESLGRLTVDEAVAKARALQPALRAARATLGSMKERVGENASNYWPSVNAQAGYQLGSQNFVLSPAFGKFFATTPGQPITACVLPGTSTIVDCPPKAIPGESLTPYSQYTVGVNLNWTLWDFGRTLHGVDSAQSAARGAEEDLATTDHQVVLNVRADFFGALAAQQLVAVAQKQLSDMQEHLELAEGRLEVGAGAQFDVSTAKSNVATAQIVLLQNQNNFDVARATLNQAIGFAHGASYVLVEPPLDLGAEVPTVEAGTETALDARPDYKSLTEKLEAAREALLAERANFYPILGGNAGVNWTGYDFPLIYNWTAGATLTVPIFNGFVDVHKVRDLEAQADVLAANRETIALQVRLDVESAVLTAKQTRASIESAQAALAAAKDALDLATGQYQTGVGNIIQLDDAESAYVQSQANLISAGFNYEAALARLRYALGQG